MDSTFLQERITATKAMIVAYEDALIALSANPTISYRRDTGQSVTQVNRADIGLMQKTLDSLYNRYATLCARQTGGGTSIMRPSW